MKRILVIDDDTDILTLVTLLLTMNGFEVATLSQWSETFAKIEDFNPNIILMDVSLGGADGRDVCKQIKSTPSTQHIPVILFSALLHRDKKIAESLADDFIDKPFVAKELLHKLKMLLEKKVA